MVNCVSHLAVAFLWISASISSWKSTVFEQCHPFYWFQLVFIFNCLVSSVFTSCFHGLVEYPLCLVWRMFNDKSEGKSHVKIFKKNSTHTSAIMNLHCPQHLSSFKLLNIALKWGLMLCCFLYYCWATTVNNIVNLDKVPTWTIVNCFSMACLSASRAAITWYTKNTHTKNILQKPKKCSKVFPSIEKRNIEMVKWQKICQNSLGKS